MIYILFDTECNGEQILEKEVYLKCVAIDLVEEN